MHFAGIDIGPEKGGHICAEIFKKPDLSVVLKNPSDLEQYLAGLPADVLIAWDAPLTANRDTDANGTLVRQDLSQRILDAFFSRSKTGWKTPKGVPVLPYSGCPHWTISRRMLGHPRFGRYDCAHEDLPFQLITSDEPPKQGASVVEVHPALALWLWFPKHREGALDHDGKPYECWYYEGYKDRSKRGLRKELWDDIHTRWNAILPDKSGFQFKAVNDGNIPSDDEIDAIVAFILAKDFCSKKRSVAVLGNAQCGAMLLPKSPGLHEAFGKFQKSEEDARSGIASPVN